MNYFEWLCGHINVSQPDRSYYLLCKELYNKEFTWVIPNDDNRIADAKALREQYQEEIFPYEDIKHSVNFFEVTIALCYRVQDVMYGGVHHKDISDWFDILIGNLKLDIYTDDTFSNLGTPCYIRRILDNCIMRNYNFNGNGGFFPLKNRRKDQKKVEIWYQMMDYLNENYFN